VPDWTVGASRRGR